MAIISPQALFESESDGSAGALQRTVRAWSTALKSLGVKPNAKAIESVLRPTQGTRPAASMYESISNADDVVRALAKDKTYAKHVNALKAHGQWEMRLHQELQRNSTRLSDEEDPDRDALLWLEHFNATGSLVVGVDIVEEADHEVV